MPKWWVIVKEPAKVEQRYELSDGFTFGRHPRCACVLEDSAVSAKHTRIVERDGTSFIQDLGSANKTVVVDGPTLSQDDEHELGPGMVVQLGKTLLSFTQESIAKAAELGEISTVRAIKPSVVADKEPAAGRQASRSALPKQEEEIPSNGPQERPSKKASMLSALTAGGLTLTGSQMTVDYGDGSSKDSFAQLGNLGLLEAVRPRLILDNDADRRIVPMKAIEFEIGRSSKREWGCRLAHSAISSPHAKITLSGKRFFLEDLKSKNHTYLKRRRIETKVELRTDSYLRFGSVAALFVVDVDPTGERIPQSTYREALEVLVADGTITRAQSNQVRIKAEEEERHPGELLILSGAVSAMQWAGAFRRAGLRVDLKSALPRRRVRLRWIVVATVIGLGLLGLGLWSTR